MTQYGKSKYYTNGKLNEVGKKAREDAKKTKEIGSSGVFGDTMAIVSTGMHMRGAKMLNRVIKSYGDNHVRSLAAKGASTRTKGLVASGYILAMGANTALNAAPHAKYYYKKYRYRIDNSYYNKIQNNSKLKNKLD